MNLMCLAQTLDKGVCGQTRAPQWLLPVNRGCSLGRGPGPLSSHWVPGCCLGAMLSCLKWAPAVPSLPTAQHHVWAPRAVHTPVGTLPGPLLEATEPG